MKKAQFFLNALKAGRYKDKEWILAAFSVIRQSKSANTHQPWSIIYQTDEQGQVEEVLFTDENGESIEIEDYAFDASDPAPPFSFQERIALQPGDLANLRDEITSTYGNLLANQLLLVYPFGDKIAYRNERFFVKDIEKIIERYLTSTPDEKEQRDPGFIYIDEYNRFREAASLLDGLTQLCVPAATEKSLTTHPDLKQYRDELLEAYQDRLNEPEIIAYIEDELRRLDREYLEGDDSQDFFIVSGKIDIARKRTHLMLGQEGGGGQERFLPYSLSEGWDPEDMPALASGVREGSYDRSVMTAQGGEAAKFILRAMQNNQIEAEDCGSQIGVDVTINENNRDQMLYNYIITGNGVVQLTEENIDQYMNQQVSMRSPLFCRTERTGFCKVCIGGRYANHPTGLGVAASDVGNIIMDIFMQSAHAKGLEVVDYRLEQGLS